jgi:hypothetical protein
MRLLGVRRCGAHAAQDIRLLRDCFKVRWIDAMPYSAKVVDRQPDRDWPDIVLIRNSMGYILPVNQVESAVPSRVLATGPQPAVIGLVYVFPEPLQVFV